MRQYRRTFVGASRPLTCDAGEARDHLQALGEAGLGLRAAAQLTGIGYTTLRDLRQGRQARCRTATADAVLGLTFVATVDGKRIPKDDAVELVRRLSRAGVERQELAAMLGYRHPCVDFVGAHRKSITVRTWRRLVILARLLVRAGRVPPSVLEGLT